MSQHQNALAKLLLVDDDPELRRLLAHELTRRGFDVTVAASGEEMWAKLQRHLPHVLILDWMLPDSDGLSLLQRLRAQASTAHLPVLMLTARADDLDRVLGLESGADDYLTKPFFPRELEARLKALLRRTQRTSALPLPERVAIGPLVFDTVRRVLVHENGQTTALTGSDYALLSLFVRHPYEVLSREVLAQAIRHRPLSAFDRTVDMAVSRLRAKLGADDLGVPLIQAVRNQGYVLTAKVVPLS